MAVETLNVTFDGINDVPRLPGQSVREWFGTPPDTTFLDFYSFYHNFPGDSLDAEASLTGSNWRIKVLRMVGEDHHTTIKDLDNGADRRIDFLELGYNSDVDLISTRVRYIFGWDGDKHVVKLGNQQSGNTFGINLYAKENVVTTGNVWVGAIDTGGTIGDKIKIGSGGAGSVFTGGGNDVVTTTSGFVASIRTRDGNDKVNTGSNWVESIATGNGKDVVKIGAGGVGQVLLGAGDDKIHFSETDPDFGIDFRGLDGIDTVYFSGFSVGVTFSLDTTAYQNVASNKGWFRLSSTENVSGTGKGDKLTGDEGKNFIYGLNGNDKLFGLAGADTLIGAKGKDVLSGDKGNDKLRGGSGEDVFVFRANAGTDKVLDFQDGTDILRIAGHTGGLSGLTISNSSGDKVIDHDGGTIILVNGAGVTLTNADFDFV